MEKNNIIKINLFTVFLIILLILIIIGFFIYKLNKDKQTTDSKLSDLNNEIVRLKNVIDNLKTPINTNNNTTEILTNEDDKSIDINNYVFKLDSKNKYNIITDLRWTTMQNDGGSHSSIYYQIDLDNNIISKVQENYYANLTNTPNTEENIIYTKKIDTNFQKEIKSLLDEIIIKEDINETHNYNFFTISSLNIKKEIYSISTIKSINNLLTKIDEN